MPSRVTPSSSDWSSDTDQVKVVPYRPSPKSKTIAILLCMFVTGIFGAHYYYLKRQPMGQLYLMTFGLFGIGWIVDWFRICSLVNSYNDAEDEARDQGYWIISEKYGKLKKRSLVDSYFMWCPPYGLLGYYHWELGRALYGRFSIFSICGWVVDFFRMPGHVSKANHEIEKMRRGEAVEATPYSLLDAYLLVFPFGLFGLHHFYLDDHERGYLYFCTLGLCGLGWLADLYRLPRLVAEANRDRRFNESMRDVLCASPLACLADPPARHVTSIPIAGRIHGISVISSNAAPTSPSLPRVE